MAAEKPKIELEKIGQFNEQGKMFLRSGEHKKLFAYFKNLYINRV